MTTAETIPGTPSRTIAQSDPGERRRRVSQPSYSLPRWPNPGSAWAGCGSTRFSLAAKNSSLAASTAPPSARLARSGRGVGSLIGLLAGIAGAGVTLARGGEAPGGRPVAPEEDPRP